MIKTSAGPVVAPALDSRARVREMTFQDHAQIAALTLRHGIRTEPYEQWTSLWLGNPAFKSTGGEWPLGWVVEDRNIIVGSLTNIPQKFVFRGRTLLAATSRTWIVDQRHRAYGALLLDMHFTQPKVDLFVHPTVNANASAAYATFNALPVPVGRWDRATFWITGHMGVVQSRLRMKQVPLAAAVSAPIAAMSYVKDTLTTKRLGRAGDLPPLQECHSFDERFDAFWHSLQSTFPNMLLASRDADTLQWHFQHSLAAGKAAIVVASQGGAIIGYAIFFRNDNHKIGLRRLRLADFRALERSDDVLIAALSWALRKCRREKIHMFENIGFRPGGTTIVEDLAPHSRALPNWLYYYKPRNRALAEELADPSVWSPCAYDGDASL